MATILIVDDDAGVCRTLSAALRVAGHTPYAVHAAADALELLGTVLIDLVILEIMMPGIDGLGVLARIRADGRTAGQKVVLYSEVASLFADDPRARRADRVVSKATPVAELLSDVESLVNDGRRRRR